MEKTGIAFDFDGTIIDSEVHWLALTREIFGELTGGREWTDEEHRRLVGNGTRKVHRIFREEYGVTMAWEDFEPMVWTRSHHIYESHARLNDGVLETLQKLEGLGIPMAVASGGFQRRIELASERLGIRRFFRAISSGDQVPKDRNKPRPDVYLRAADALGVKAVNCFAVEDSDVGLQSAMAARTVSVAYHSPHNESQRMADADIHINHFAELTGDRIWNVMRERRRCTA